MKKSFEQIFNEADAAGMKAVAECVPQPMYVSGYQEPILGGVCGFAWVTIKPANSGFAKWLVTQGIARKHSFEPGVCILVSQFGQSMERKEAYAEAAASSLKENGINAFSGSRMD